jgi:hypothetical protein
MFWPGNALAERWNIPSVEVNRNLGAHRINTGEVDVGKTEPLPFAHVKHNVPPGVDHQRMSKCIAPISMMSALGCCDDKGC